MKEHQVSDVIETTETAEAVDTVEAPETPATETAEETASSGLSDEQIAEYLGVDPEYFAEVKGSITNLNGFYAKVNKRNMELVERERALSQQPTPAASDEDDDDVELDEASQKVLRKFIEREVGDLRALQQQTVAQQMQAVVDDYAESHSDVPPDRVDAVMNELGLWSLSDTPAKFKANLERAYKLAKAEMFDPEAEVAKRLAESTKPGEEVVEVKPKRTAVQHTRTADEIMADENVPWTEKLKLFSNAG